MAFTGDEDHLIGLEEAVQLTLNYREKAGEKAIKGGFFGKTAIQDSLNQDGCVGIKYYQGQKNNGTPCLVLVGADAAENDLTGGIIAERELPCPPYCGMANALNSYQGVYKHQHLHRLNEGQLLLPP